jgi:hypothetical protein
VTHYEKRLQRLERGFPRRPIAVEAAKRRGLARLYLRIGATVGLMEHPLVRQAEATLINDTPAQAEHDLATLQRWAQQHPELMRHETGARDRIAAKLDAMARRLEGHHGEVL